MLLHLPIAILTTLSPIPISDAVPKLDIAKECSFEGGASDAHDRCVREETDALRQVQGSWSQYTAADRNSCTVETVTGGYASYVELLSCLEMARDAAKANDAATANNGSEGASADHATVGAAKSHGHRPPR